MAVYIRSRIWCNQSRARSLSRSRPTNSSKTAEGLGQMGRKAAQEMARGTARAAKHSDQRLIALFLDMLAAERGAEKNTLAAYGRDLADFSAFLLDAGQSVAAATTDNVRAYLSQLARRGMQPATVARRLSAIRQLYRFLYAEGRRKDDPAAVLEGPKRVRALPKTLTLAEVDR